MIGFPGERLGAMFGRGRYSCSVPVMDGPLQPNRGLDEADILLQMPGIDNLTGTADGIVFSAGDRLYRAGMNGKHEPDMEFGGEITCIAAAPGGALAIGVDGEGIFIRGGAFDQRPIEKPLTCATAALFLDDETLIVASGSASCKAADWKLDLMSHGRTGALWRFDLAHGESECLSKDLAWPYGLCTAPDETLLVSEAWRHRLLRLDQKGETETVLQDLPGYPSRISPASGGGYWLALFAPRNQLVEFILREHSYRRDMIKHVSQAYWIAPALATGASFKEPLQGGAVKQMGILKPWAPVWSYGLVVHLGPDFQPLASWHSRADGDRHGVTSVCEKDGFPVVSAKGAGLALAFDTATAARHAE